MSKLGPGSFDSPFGIGTVGKKCRRLFIVGCDGSSQAYRGILVASQVMDIYKDNMMILFVGNGPAAASDVKAQCTRVFDAARPLMTAVGIPVFRQGCKYLQKPDDWKSGPISVQKDLSY